MQKLFTHAKMLLKMCETITIQFESTWCDAQAFMIPLHVYRNFIFSAQYRYSTVHSTVYQHPCTFFYLKLTYMEKSDQDGNSFKLDSD